jgi:hypothetical protein
MQARVIGGWLTVLAVVLLLGEPAAAKKCHADAVQVGEVCVDQYEASVWEIAPADTALIKKVRKSKVASAADLAGATQRGATGGGDYGAGCPVTANGCKDLYAVSIAGVTPSFEISWFQAAAACRNAGKRLPTNQEWQMAALGTPDPGPMPAFTDCNTGQFGYALATGSISGCVSDMGAFDMVGNLAEWVADWADHGAPAGVECTTWPASFGSDTSCMGSAGSDHLPAALIRGGSRLNVTGAGVFAVDNSFAVFPIAGSVVGFRCARDL